MLLCVIKYVLYTKKERKGKNKLKPAYIHSTIACTVYDYYYN
jgi:hypothetical protein